MASTVTDFGGQRYWQNGLVATDLFADSVLEVEVRPTTEPIGGQKYWQNGLPYCDLFKYYTYTETPSGGILIGGDSSYGIIYSITPEGGIQIGGTGNPGVLFTITPSGGIVFGGSGIVPETFNLGNIIINSGTSKSLIINQRALFTALLNTQISKNLQIQQLLEKQLELLDG